VKPVLVLQHLSGDGPAYLAEWLRAQGVPFEVFDTEAGQAYPSHIDAYAALAVLGGEMSANDELPSLRQAELLIRQAIAQCRPVIGHCLGGQLMARALGASVHASPAPEIGWQEMQVLDGALAREWFGAAAEHTVFQWHSEAFDLPPGAQPLATSVACPQQAFAIGPHLGMQFHVELDGDKLGRWSASRDPQYLALQRSCPTVHSGPAMREEGERRLARQQRLADRLYARWLAAAG